MYAKVQNYRSARFVTSYLYQQFIRCLHPNRKNLFEHRSIIKQFYKNNPIRHKHDGDNGKRKYNVLNMINSEYLNYIYKAWLKDTKSVNSSWDSYFKLIHAESPKVSHAKLKLTPVSTSALKLMTSNLKGGQLGNSEF
ncbi:2-oxoglutarate dehydrogenase, mitochondrial-like [Pogonomyrmex barbatus]|uniref:2-oxoglutarate dehydrogenase, mitochondrial-like n=1 Tax=Pogonomyrmex barbatus TaxID=144034 RepID=A0A8N1S9U4_9HYME|nr:2-oxoglutarate dehydrogenase, mitochondrial-like [Pogonomyrmex barbatus]